MYVFNNVEATVLRQASIPMSESNQSIDTIYITSLSWSMAWTGVLFTTTLNIRRWSIDRGLGVSSWFKVAHHYHYNWVERASLLLDHFLSPAKEARADSMKEWTFNNSVLSRCTRYACRYIVINERKWNICVADALQIRNESNRRVLLFNPALKLDRGNDHALFSCGSL